MCILEENLTHEGTLLTSSQIGDNCSAASQDDALPAIGNAPWRAFTVHIIALAAKTDNMATLESIWELADLSAEWASVELDEVVEEVLLRIMLDRV
jgi:hypothetical protein